MMRDPRIWGDEADIFKPERFLPEYNPRVNELPDVESLPFGFGRRYVPLILSAGKILRHALSLEPVLVDTWLKETASCSLLE
jgi:hypothetical protein